MSISREKVELLERIFSAACFLKIRRFIQKIMKNIVCFSGLHIEI